MRIIHAAVAAACLAASPAFAADDGFYVGAGLGYFQLDVGSWNGSDTGFKFTGGYNFMKYFGAEVEWIDGGSPEDFDLSIDTSGWNFSAVGRWPVTEQFNLFAKAGAFLWDVHAHGFGSDNGTDFSWGLGMGWNFTDHFTLNGEYQSFDIEDSDGADFWSASAVWRF